MMSSVPKITQLGSEFGREPKMISSGDPMQPVLPHLGTYVIDTPRDKNWTWRQKCLHYHETHRGVLRTMKVNPLPDIPKRYDLCTLPEQQEASSTGSTSVSSSASEYPSGQATAASDSHWVHGGRSELSAPRPRTRSLSPLHSTRNKEKQGELNGEHSTDKPFNGFITLRPTNKRYRNKELTTSVPCYTSLCTLKEIQTSNLWRVKPDRNERLGDFRATSINQHILSKHNDVKNILYEKEMPESAARISPMDEKFENGDEPLKLKSLAAKNKNSDDVFGDVRTLGKFRPPSPAIPPVKHVGHTSRYKEWSNMRLSEVLKDRPVPGGVRENPPGGEGRRKTTTTRDRFGEEAGHVGDKGEGANVDSSWLHVVNTPLIDKDMYDRYARVKLL